LELEEYLVLLLYFIFVCLVFLSTTLILSRAWEGGEEEEDEGEEEEEEEEGEEGEEDAYDDEEDELGTTAPTFFSPSPLLSLYFI
jgi:flagellar biosynthesis/type III secretory pathway M-ring protein FliF/YscJ